MCSFLTKFYQGLIAVGDFLQPFFLLAIRLFWGWQFFKTGIGKFADIGQVASYFETLRIPAPELNAYLAAAAETVGGLFLLLGFASRLAALPLMGTMVVALLTAHREATLMILDDPVAFVGQPPFTFLMAAAIVFIFGPGSISIDGLIKKIQK